LAVVVPPQRPGHFELSFKPAPNWNGPYSVTFVCMDIWGLYSVPQTVSLTVRPINDACNYVKGRTRCDTVRCVVKSNTECLIEDIERGGTAWKINDRDGGDFHPTQSDFENNKLTFSDTSSSGQSQSRNNDNQDNRLVVNQCTLQVYDIDFVFGHALAVNITSFNGYQIANTMMITNADTTISAKRASTIVANDLANPEISSANTFVRFEGDISALNTYLQSTGFYLTIVPGSASAFVVITISDLGNVDFYNRPLTTTFTMQIFPPVPLPPAAVPIAIIAILPIIAAAAALILAAAWLTLGKSANAMVANNFDAFAAESCGAGNISPLYDAQGQDLKSPLYNNKP